MYQVSIKHFNSIEFIFLSDKCDISWKKFNSSTVAIQREIKSEQSQKYVSGVTGSEKLQWATYKLCKKATELGIATVDTCYHYQQW